MANYLYNGIEMPERPERDAATYPYEYIVPNSADCEAYHLYALNRTVVVQHLSDSTNGLYPPGGYNESEIITGCWYIWTPSEEYAENNAGSYPGINTKTWTQYATDESMFTLAASVGPIWSNTDLYDIDGNLFLAASEPVAVPAGTLRFAADGVATLYNPDGTVYATYTGWDTDVYNYWASLPEDGVYPPWYADGNRIAEVIIEDGATVKSTDEWFHNNKDGSVYPNLTSALIGTGITEIGFMMFANCTALANVSMSDSVTALGFGAFSDCSALTSVTIPASVKQLAVSFYRCTGLTSVTFENPKHWWVVPETFDKTRGTRVDVSDSAVVIPMLTDAETGYYFYRKELDLKSWLTGYLTSLCGPVVSFPSTQPTAYPTMAASNTWYKSTTPRSTITEINIVDTYTAMGNETESWAADVDGTGSIMCYVTGTVLTMVGNGSGKIMANADASDMFMYFSALTSLDLHILDTSNVADMGRMFWGCSALTNLDLSNFDTSNVTYMAQIFESCSSLASLDLSGWNISNVTNLYDVFNGCSALTSLDLSGWDTSNVTNMDFTFKNCSALTSLDLRSWDTSNVTSIVGIFQYCSNLTAIYVGDGWNTSNASYTSGMFTNCGVSAVTYV